MLGIRKKETENSPKLWVLLDDKNYLSNKFSPEKSKWLKKELFDNDKDRVILSALGQPLEIFIRPEKDAKTPTKQRENCRILSAKILSYFDDAGCDSVEIAGNAGKELLLATAEGLALSAYRFVKYFSEPEEKRCKLQEIAVVNSEVTTAEVAEQNALLAAVVQVRDWVNEPACVLTATKFAEEMAAMAQRSSATVDVLSKKKIEALKMGGLLSVNQGSEEPPTFTVMEWKPKNAVNSQPVVLVGKGVTFDTGGSNLKTENYMDDMKTDMAGAATVAATLCAIAENKLPLHVIALMPATDNKLSNNAIVPSDIITMHNGKTVEVSNTDAEGRLILADAISYAARFNPMLIVNVATLTGSALRAIGKYGMVMMGNAREAMDKLKTTGDAVYERVAELPFWDDYADELKSEIADMKNIGGADGGGAITAGKFLEKFTDAPFVHLDIAGCACLSKPYGWQPSGGTGIGVRLLYHFLKNIN
ncbi:MAG: leucyl aminopeptidase family protein [Bacteroidales bacterium]|nr:leucyl aminopeptidase family protein [Bacteroidales bacterium]